MVEGRLLSRRGRGLPVGGERRRPGLVGADEVEDLHGTAEPEKRYVPSVTSPFNERTS